MTSSSRILVVIADGLLRQSVAEHFRATAQWSVTEAADRAEALAHAPGHHLAVVDEALDASALCLGLREAGIAMPLLLLGSAAVPCQAGIEAVVPKPLRLTVLVTRIREILARPAGVRIGHWRFDETRAALDGDCGALVRLTAKECAILGRLHRAAGLVVARETLLGEVWGYGADIDTHTLETHIYKLRRKLGGGVLVSENGGYRLESRP